MKTLQLLPFLAIWAISASAQWTSTGIDVSTLKNVTTKRVSLTDGNYGSIVCFTTCDTILNNIYVNAQIYAQRISPTGVLLWGTANNPKAVCTMPNNQVLSDAVEDGIGGAFLAWDDYRSGSGKPDVYVQHINSSGTSVWMDNGIKVSNSTSTKNQGAKLCPDGNGGVIVCWDQIIFDSAVNMTTYAQIFAQKYDAAGIPTWATNGLQICTVAGMRKLPQIVTDKAGGVIVFFMDTRYSYQLQPQPQYVEIWREEFSNLDMYAQKISAAGVLQWTQAGTIIANDPGNQMLLNPDLKISAVSDSSGGAMIVYSDLTNSPAGRGQYINNEGIRQWPNSGKVIPVGTNSIKSDGKKGMLTVSTYFRGGMSSAGFGVSLVRVQNDGVIKTSSNLLSNSSQGQYSSNEEVGTDGSGNYIAVWEDNDNSIVNTRRVDSVCATISPLQGMLGNLGAPQPNTCPQLVQSNPGSAIITINHKTGPSAATQLGIIRAAKLDYNLPLPLLLQKFSATNNKGEVLLTWTTASEQNTLNFEVQRSVDNIQFTTIGMIASGGNSNQLLNYQLIDKSPLSGINYYRLKMIDNDGRFTYSEIKQIKIAVVDWTVRPLNNPVQNKAWLTFASAKNQQLEYILYSSLGQRILSRKVQLVPGSITIGLDISSFPAGKYWMKVQAGKETATIQIQKL